MPVRNQNTIKADAAQEAAIRHFMGPCLVAAGPGSGKTFVLTGRAACLTADHHIPPENILVLTFSKAAALQMRQRYLAIAPDGCEDVRFHTFHAFCYEILRQYTGRKPGTISAVERLRLIDSIRKRCAAACQDKSFTGMETAEAARIVSLIKHGMTAAVPVIAGADTAGRAMEAVRREYDAYLRERDLLDFDDMILECIRLLSGNAGILAQVRKSCAFIMVDEFQDVSPAQFDLLRMLAGCAGNLFAVGDDDQGIYGFRGAGPGIFRQFLDCWSNARVLYLDINYRCPEEVARIAANVIRHNSDRLDKQIISGAGCRGEIRTAAFPDRRREYEAIADWIRSRRSSVKTVSGSAGSTCILLRMSGQAVRLFGVLEKAGIRYASSIHAADGTDAAAAAFLQDLIAYAEASLHVSDGRGDPAFLRRILNRPERGLRMPAGPGIPDPALDAFLRQLTFAGRLSAPHWYRFVTDTLHYGDFFRHKIRPNLREPEEEIIRRAEHFSLTASSIEDLLHELRCMAEDLSGEEGRGKERTDRYAEPEVRIMTMHTAKGLEFDTVFLPDLNEGVIPARAAKTKAASEEERRLFYVAMTRARKRLFLSFIEDPENAAPPASRFLKETGTAYTRDRF